VAVNFLKKKAFSYDTKYRISLKTYNFSFTGDTAVSPNTFLLHEKKLLWNAIAFMKLLSPRMRVLKMKKEALSSARDIT
jgi:hypothetical protein